MADHEEIQNLITTGVVFIYIGKIPEVQEQIPIKIPVIHSSDGEH